MNVLEHYNETWAKIDKGKLTVAEVIAAHNFFSERIDELTAAVSKMTVKELKARLRARSGEKKAFYVEKFVDNRLSQFPWLIKDVFMTTSFSFSDMSRMTAAEYRAHNRAKELKARTEILSTLTQEHLDAHVEKIAQREADERARAAAMIEAMKNPKTVADWVYFLDARRKERGADRTVAPHDLLDDDELRRLDAAVFSENEKRMRELAADEAKISRVETTANLIVRQDFHTKKECDIWVVSLSGRVPKSEYKQLRDAAQKLGARWSRWSEGFIFYSQERAETFAGVTEGETDTTKFQLENALHREQRAGERLDQYAIRKDGRAVDALSMERLANTARRVSIANSMETNARWEIAFAATMQSIATALVNNELWGLCGVRYGTDIAELYSVMNRAHFDAKRADELPFYEDRPVHVNDVRFAKVPYPNLTGGQLSRLHRETKGKRGVGNARKIVDEMIPKKDTGSVVATHTARQARSIIALIEKLGLQNDDEFSWRLDSFKRFERMGLVHLPILRHALREFIAHVAAPNQPDKLTQMVRDLVGVKIGGYYPTPAHVADHMVRIVNPMTNETGVETSAGSGNLIDAILRHDSSATIDYYESSSQLREVTTFKYRDNLNVNCVGCDGERVGKDERPDDGYDYAIINPPFERSQDVVHVSRTYNALKSGGRMAAIVSASRAAEGTAFMMWLEEKGGYVDMELPSGTFAEAGTNVRSVILYVEK